MVAGSYKDYTRRVLCLNAGMTLLTIIFHLALII